MCIPYQLDQWFDQFGHSYHKVIKCCDARDDNELTGGFKQTLVVVECVLELFITMLKKHCLLRL